MDVRKVESLLIISLPRTSVAVVESKTFEFESRQSCSAFVIILLIGKVWKRSDSRQRSSID